MRANERNTHGNRTFTKNTIMENVSTASYLKKQMEILQIKASNIHAQRLVSYSRQRRSLELPHTVISENGTNRSQAYATRPKGMMGRNHLGDDNVHILLVMPRAYGRGLRRQAM